MYFKSFMFKIKYFTSVEHIKKLKIYKKIHDVKRCISKLSKSLTVKNANSSRHSEN